MKKINIVGIIFILLTTFTSRSQEEFSSEMDYVIQLLQINSENVDHQLSIVKPMRYIPEMMAFAILEKVGESNYSEEDLKKFRCHVVLYNASDKLITNQFIIENLESDTIRLSRISFDFAPYMVKSDKRAFGIRISYSNFSRANPYEEEQLTLFIQENDKLIPVLKDYPSYLSSGYWDTNCAGEFNEKKSVIFIETTSTRGFFDIKVNNKEVKTINEVVSGDCKVRENAVKSTTYLVYFNGSYQVKR